MRSRIIGAVIMEGRSQAGTPPIGGMLWNSFVMALAITVGKLSISLLSAFAIVYFRFPFRIFFFWIIFLTLMLPVEVRIVPTLSGRGRSGDAEQLCGPLDSSDRQRNGHVPVPAVFHDCSRGIDGRLRRVDGAGPMKFFKDILIPLLDHQYRGTLRDHVHLWLEPVSLAAADYDRP